MAQVIHKKYQPGEQVFGGSGVAVFRPYRKTQSPSETVGLTPEERLASAAEASLMRQVMANQQPNTAQQRQTQPQSQASTSAGNQEPQ